MAKLTQAQLTALLSKLLSQDVELVENDADSDFNEEALISAIDKGRTPIIKQLVSKDIHGQALRTTNTAYRSSISKLFNIPLSEIEGLESEELLTRAMEAYKSTLPDAGKDAQKKIDEMLKAHADEKQKITQEFQQKHSELESRLTRKSMIDVLRKYHKDASGLPEKANRDKLAEVFLSHLQGNAIVKLNDAGDEIELYDPKNPETRLLNSSSTANVSVSDMMKPYYLDLGMWNEDTRDVSATTAAKNVASKIAATTQQTTAQPMGNASASYAEFAQNFQ